MNDRKIDEKVLTILSAVNRPDSANVEDVKAFLSDPGAEAKMIAAGERLSPHFSGIVEAFDQLNASDETLPGLVAFLSLTALASASIYGGSVLSLGRGVVDDVWEKFASDFSELKEDAVVSIVTDFVKSESEERPE